MNYAIIEGGAVANIIIWDGESDWASPQESAVVKIPDGTAVVIGSTYDGETFTLPPNPPSPF